MRHQRKTIKLGRSQSHRNSLLANQICSLIEHHRITTTLAKAKAVRPLAEKMVTLGKKKTLHARRVALSTLRHNEKAVKRLFDEVAPRAATRNGGYTRIIKLGQRKSDSAPMAVIEWVDGHVDVEEAAPKPAKSTTARKGDKPGKTAKEAAPSDSKAGEKKPNDQESAAAPEKKRARKPRADKTAEKAGGE